MDLVYGIRYQGKTTTITTVFSKSRATRWTINVEARWFQTPHDKRVTWKNAQLKPVGSVRLMSYTYKTIPDVNERESNSAFGK